MRREPLFALLLAVGCSRPAAPALVVVPPAPAPGPSGREVAPWPRAVYRLTPEAAVPDLTPQPHPAGLRAGRYHVPAQYPGMHFGPTPAPTQMPDLPIRSPARVIGDLRFMAPGSAAGGVALSPDGRRLAFGTCLFDAATGELDAMYDEGGSGVHRLTFSPDGTRLYCGVGPYSNVPTHGHTLAVREVPGRRHLLTVQAVAWALSGDGRLLATVEQQPYDPFPDWDGPRLAIEYLYPAVRVYDTASWKGLTAYRVHGGVPTAVALNPDGSHLAIGFDDGTVRVIDRPTGRELACFRELCETSRPTHKPAAYQLMFSPDGRMLAAANARQHDYDTPRQVAWWRWPAGTLVHVRPAAAYYDPSDLRFSPDGRYLFAGRPGGASVWDTRTGERVTELVRDRDNRVVPAVAFAADGRVFASGGTRPAVLDFPTLAPRLWPDRPFLDTPPSPGVPTVEPMPPAAPLAYPHPGFRLPNGGRVRMLRPFDEREAGFEQTDAAGKRVRHYEPGRTGWYAVSPDGTLLITCTRTTEYGKTDPEDYVGAVRFWDLATGKELGQIRVYPKPDGCPAFSPDSRRLALRHSDGLFRVWDVSTRTPTLALDPAGWWFDRLTFSTDGTKLFAGMHRSAVMLEWDVAGPAR